MDLAFNLVLKGWRIAIRMDVEGSRTRNEGNGMVALARRWQGVWCLKQVIELIKEGLYGSRNTADVEASCVCSRLHTCNSSLLGASTDSPCNRTVLPSYGITSSFSCRWTCIGLKDSSQSIPIIISKVVSGRTRRSEVKQSCPIDH